MGLQFSPLLKHFFSILAYSMSSIMTSLLNLVKIRKLLKENVFPSVALFKYIFIILSILSTIASDRQIDSRAIETFQDGPFGRVVEDVRYK